MQSPALSLLRVVAAFAYSLHGYQKLFGAFGGHLGKGSLHDYWTLTGLGGVLETFGGALLMLGLFTRPVAFILSGEMAFAYFMRHAVRGFWPIQNGGELAALYCFLFLYLATAGGGSISLDRWLRKVRD
jgi:putative oxidoreductase